MKGTCPCGGCCPCHRLKHGETRWNAWTPEQEAFILARSAEGASLTEIADAFERRFRYRRGVDGIRVRLSKLGASVRDGWLTRRDVERLLGVHHRDVQRWVQSGALIDRPHQRGHWRLIAPADLDTFVRAQAGRLFDPARVADRRLRSLAETSAQINLREAAS